MEGFLPRERGVVADLYARGFKDADQVRDIGSVVDGLVYVSREFQGQFQYVWLCHYGGALVEGGLEVFDRVKNTRGKEKQIPLFLSLYRNITKLLTDVEKIYGTQRH